MTVCYMLNIPPIFQQKINAHRDVKKSLLICVNTAQLKQHVLITEGNRYSDIVFVYTTYCPLSVKS